MNKAYIFIRTALEDRKLMDNYKRAMIDRVRNLRYDYEGIFSVSGNPKDSIRNFKELTADGHLDDINILFFCVSGEGGKQIVSEIKRYLKLNGMDITLYLIDPRVLV